MYIIYFSLNLFTSIIMQSFRYLFLLILFVIFRKIHYSSFLLQFPAFYLLKFNYIINIFTYYLRSFDSEIAYLSLFLFFPPIPLTIFPSNFTFQFLLQVFLSLFVLSSSRFIDYTFIFHSFPLS